MTTPNGPRTVSSDSMVVKEMTYTEAEVRCNDPYIAEDGTLRECCRPRWHGVHDPRHASNFPLTFW